MNEIGESSLLTSKRYTEYPNDDSYGITHENEGFVTNFDWDEEPIYQKAIEEYGDSRIKIHPKAYDVYGNLRPELRALVFNGNPEETLDGFWEVFDKIEEEWYKK